MINKLIQLNLDSKYKSNN